MKFFNFFPFRANVTKYDIVILSVVEESQKRHLLWIKITHTAHTKNMERTVKETYDALYSSSLESLEKNLDRLIEAKHNDFKSRLENKAQNINRK